jgi:cysteine desulfurase
MEAMKPYFDDFYYNPSSLYENAQNVRQDLENARKIIMSILKASKGRIIFTGGGSESDNLAIKGFAYANRKKGNHIITTKIEHHAVLKTCAYLEKNGFEVTYVPVDEKGVVDIEAFGKAMRPDTILASVMTANNETGVIQPVQELAQIARKNGTAFHTDAVQAAGKIKLDVEELGVDLLTLSAHKIYGPKGTGLLYVRNGIKLDALVHGGSQESGLRAGTENVAGIIGFAKALELAEKERESEALRLSSLRNFLETRLLEVVPDCQVNGKEAPRLPNTTNIIIKYVEGEALLFSLSDAGIALSSGSACTSGELEPSHVLLAMGIPHELAHGSLRFSLGKMNSEEEVEKVLKSLPEVVERLRAFSPFGRDKEELQIKK